MSDEERPPMDRGGYGPAPTLWNHGEAPSFTCPACGATSYHLMDVRYGYCGRCHDFTGEPTDFVFPDDPGFGERVADRMRHYYVPREPLAPDLFEANRKALDEEMVRWRMRERWALEVQRPESFVLLSGEKAVNHLRGFDEFKDRVLLDPKVRRAYRWSTFKWRVWGQWAWRWERRRYWGRHRGL